MKKNAFTLAEVLITLGVIGVVAAMTIPTLISYFQEKVLLNQFKNFYSTFTQGIKYLQAIEGRSMSCYYWESSPYKGKCNAYCPEENKTSEGRCMQYVCRQTGEVLPEDYNGPYNECSTFKHDLFTKALKTAKICEKDAYENGCLPRDIRGTDKVKEEQGIEYVNYSDSTGSLFNDNHIKKVCPVYVLSNGMYFISYYTTGTGLNGETKIENAPVFAVDINGFAGPNKWGYDILTFQMMGTKEDGFTRLNGLVYATDVGGKDFNKMMKEAKFK